MDRKLVYVAIDSERDYQEKRWGGTPHSLEEWIMYIEDYTAEAKHLLSRGAEESVIVEARDIMRKVAALSVACLEQHGARNR